MRTVAPESSAPTNPGPRSVGRLIGLDIARGLAVLGMVAAHVGHTTEGWTTFAGWLDIAHGRSSILFATLAGVSVGLLTGAARPYTGLAGLQARTRIFARSAVLIAIVGVLSVFNANVALILGFYAVWFVLALPFVRWSARRLLIAGPLVAVLGSIAAIYLNDLMFRLDVYAMDVNAAFVEAMLGLYPGLMWMGFVLTGLGLSKLDLASVRTLSVLAVAGALTATLGYAAGALVPSYDDDAAASADESGWGGGADPSPDIREDGTYLDEDGWVIYPSGDIDLPDGARANTEWTRVELVDGTVLEGAEAEEHVMRFVGIGDDWIDAGVTAEDWQNKDADADASDLSFVSDEDEDDYAAEGFTFDSESDWPGWKDFGGAEAHSSTPYEALGSGGVAVAVIALCCLIPGRLRIVFRPLASVGAMALTAYVAHVLMIHFGASYFAERETNVPLLVMWGILLVVCTLWIRLLGRGPLEAFLRWASIKAASLPAEAADADRR